MRAGDLLPDDQVRLPTWTGGPRRRVVRTEGDTVYLEGADGEGEQPYANHPQWVLVSRPAGGPRDPGLSEHRDAAYQRLLALCGTRGGAPRWDDIQTLLREREWLYDLIRKGMVP